MPEPCRVAKTPKRQPLKQSNKVNCSLEALAAAIAQDQQGKSVAFVGSENTQAQNAHVRSLFNASAVGDTSSESDSDENKYNVNGVGGYTNNECDASFMDKTQCMEGVQQHAQRGQYVQRRVQQRDQLCDQQRVQQCDQQRSLLRFTRTATDTLGFPGLKAIAANARAPAPRAHKEIRSPTEITDELLQMLTTAQEDKEANAHAMIRKHAEYASRLAEAAEAHAFKALKLAGHSPGETDGSHPPISSESYIARGHRLQQNRQYRQRLIEHGIHATKLGPDAFGCSKCNQVFRKEMLVWRHGVKHLGVKPFQCVQCLATFNRADSLHRHVRNFHLSRHTYDETLPTSQL